MQQSPFIDLFKSAVHVSGDKLAHPQEHFLTVYTAFGTMHRYCCRPVVTGRQQYRSIVRVCVCVCVCVCTRAPENVEYFNCLGSMITSYARCTREIKSNIAMARTPFSKKKAPFTSKLDLNLGINW